MPTLYYRDAIAAIRWLEQAFGFELNALVMDGGGAAGAFGDELSRRTVFSVHGGALPALNCWDPRS